MEAHLSHHERQALELVGELFGHIIYRVILVSHQRLPLGQAWLAYHHRVEAGRHNTQYTHNHVFAKT